MKKTRRPRTLGQILSGLEVTEKAKPKPKPARTKGKMTLCGLRRFLAGAERQVQRAEKRFGHTPPKTVRVALLHIVNITLVCCRTDIATCDRP